jgi:hypothetical protein
MNDATLFNIRMRKGKKSISDGTETWKTQADEIRVSPDGRHTILEIGDKYFVARIDKKASIGQDN